MESQSLTAALQSSGPDTSQSAPADTGQVQDGGHSESADYVGFTPDDANSQQQSQSDQFKFAETFAPETVLGHDAEGKPITVGEWNRSFLREGDYTKKTQELSEQRKAQEEAIQFVEANREYVSRLQSPDVNERAAVLREIAENFGVDLGQSQGRPRDAAGRFAPAQSGELNPEEWDEGAKPLVEALNASNSRYAQLESKFEQLIGGLQSVQQQAQARDEAVTLAHEWQAKGFKADVDGALAHVGKPMTVQQAMQLHNLEAMLRHTMTVATSKNGQQKPNEPGGGASRPVESSKFGLTERLRQGITT